MLIIELNSVQQINNYYATNLNLKKEISDQWSPAGGPVVSGLCGLTEHTLSLFAPGRK